MTGTLAVPFFSAMPSPCLADTEARITQPQVGYPLYRGIAFVEFGEDAGATDNCANYPAAED